MFVDGDEESNLNVKQAPIRLGEIKQDFTSERATRSPKNGKDSSLPPLMQGRGNKHQGREVNHRRNQSENYKSTKDNERSTKRSE